MVTHWLLLFLWFHSLHSSDEVVWKVPSSPSLALFCMSSVCWNEHLHLTSVILLGLPCTPATVTTHSSAQTWTHFLLTQPNVSIALCLSLPFGGFSHTTESPVTYLPPTYVQSRSVGLISVWHHLWLMGRQVMEGSRVCLFPLSGEGSESCS